MKAVLARDLGAQRDEGGGRELGDAAAPSADHVVMRFCAKADFVKRAARVEANLFEDAALDEQGQRSVDRGFSDRGVLRFEFFVDGFGLEVVVEFEHSREDFAARGGASDAAALKEAAERFPYPVCVGRSQRRSLSDGDVLGNRDVRFSKGGEQAPSFCKTSFCKNGHYG